MRLHFKGMRYTPRLKMTAYLFTCHRYPSPMPKHSPAPTPQAQALFRLAYSETWG